MERTPVERNLEQNLDRRQYAELPRHPLVVCASLVQNPANLGGLCRTCEAFRVESLVLANEAIVQTSAFRNLAASTHHWQPLLSCPPSDLSNWFVAQQQRGYSIIALHTNPDAIPLTQLAFPRQSVLLLGQELTGIPALFIQQCDRTVTIPQFGLVESLNVQTAGAIAMYEYIRQYGSV